MSVQLFGLENLPEIGPGDDLVPLLLEALAGRARAGDILVVTHKIVSKSEGCIVDLRDIEPSPLAVQWSERWNKDPRQTEVVLRESQSIVRMERGVIVSRTHHGLVCANAGVDRSNIAQHFVCTLPSQPDHSAMLLHRGLSESLGFHLPVLISDSFGRPWRLGIVNVAIGVAGMQPFDDYRGQTDPQGNVLEASVMATADAICSAAELAGGKCAQIPAVLVRGVSYLIGPGTASDLVRPLQEDFFR